MGLLSRLKLRADQPAATRSPLAPEHGRELWRKAKFLTRSAGEDLEMVYARGKTPKTFPSFAVEFVLGCKVFGPLDDHIDHFAQKHDWNSLQVEALRSWLPQLIESELLVSGDDLRRKCAAMRGSGAAPPPIDCVGFPTAGNRAALLQRCVASFVENAKRHARTVDFVVADGSADPTHLAQNEACLAQIARQSDTPLLYIGLTEKRRFAQLLAKETGCNPENIEFAFFDPLLAGFNCGANRNTLLLHAAGRMLCNVDDDVVCRLAMAPESDAQLSSFSQCDPFVRQFFPDRASAFAAARWQDADFVGLHEEMLGRDLGTFFGEHLAANALDLAHVGDDFLGRLDGPGASIRTTFTGHVGDPGMPTSVYYLYAEGEGRRALPQDEREYHAVFASRSVLTCVKNRAVGDESVSPGMAMGLDHRELLPPFFPVLHAEDYVFGAAVWQCCRNSIAGHLPVAVLHDPAPGKPLILPADLNRERRAVIFEFAHILRRLILHNFEPGENSSSAQRTTALGRRLAECASMTHPDFVEYLRRHVLEQESSVITFLEEQLEKAEDPPIHWRRDVERYLDHIREALTFDDFDIPFEMKGARDAGENRVLMQRLLGRYGMLLEEWPAVVEGARALRARGASWVRTLGA